MATLLRDAVNHADVIVGVIQASGKDIEAQGAAHSLIQEAGKGDRALWVINRASKANKLAQDAAARIGKQSAAPPVLIGDRVDHVKARYFKLRRPCTQKSLACAGHIVPP
jgi:hypothetical protein